MIPPREGTNYEALREMNTPKKKRRHPLHKERFLEGTRQKWMLVFLLSGGAVLGVTAVYGIDPIPFMQFLTVSVAMFIAGATGSSMIKEFKTGSIEEAKINMGGESYSPEEEDNLYV